MLATKTTMNGEYDASLLKILRQHISRKRNELVDKWTLHHNIVRPHVAIFNKTYFSKCSINIMSHPLYSPDFSPCDF